MPGEPGSEERWSGAQKQGFREERGSGAPRGREGSRGSGTPRWEVQGGGVPGVGGSEEEGSRRPGGAAPPAEPASLAAGEPRASEDENFSSPGKARQGARLPEGRSSAERRGGRTMFPGPHALPRARGSGGREAGGRPGGTRTGAARPAPPRAASPLPPTLQQVAAAPRARVPFLAPGPAPAGGHQYPS